MLLPIGDSPRDPRHVPGATLVLILVNVIVGIVTLPLMYQAWGPGDLGFDSLITNAPHGQAPPFSGHTLIVWSYGFRPSQPSLTTSVTSMFLHAGSLHLFFNALYLWIYGPNVERRLGLAGFLLLYFTAGILGAMLFALVRLGTEVPVIGASGAISGILGAYLVFFPVNRIRLAIPPISLPAWIVLLLYLLMDMWPILTQSDSSVAHAAHLGGFFGGALLAAGLLFVDPSRSPRVAVPVAEQELHQALALVRDGLLLDAHRALTALVEPGRPSRTAQQALRHLEALEADPLYQRAAQRVR